MPDFEDFVAGLDGVGDEISSASEAFLKEELERIAETAKDKAPKYYNGRESIKTDVSSYAGDSITGEITAGGGNTPGRRVGSAVAAHEDVTKAVDQEGRGPKFISRAIDEEMGGLNQRATQWAARKLGEAIQKKKKLTGGQNATS